MKPTSNFTFQDIRDLALQGLLIALIAYGCYALWHNTQANLESRNIASGFDFLSLESGMPISNSLLPYSPTDSYGYAFLIGISNTLYVSFLGIIFSSLLGLTIGVARVSGNWLIAKLAEIYVEVFRNLPLLLILFFSYVIVLASLPIPRNSLNPVEGFFFNNRGIYIPKPVFEPEFIFVVLALIAGMAAAFFLHRKARAIHRKTGKVIPSIRMGMGIIILLPLAAWFVSGSPITWDHAVLKGFNFKGGMVIRPEFSALMTGLILYTAAFIGENVRSGIQSVDRGQINASKALGITSGLTMRRVILPQALRVIIPATTNDYTSLVKNSSLAVAIGYPDMVSVGGTIIGQNDQAIEIILMWMGVYMAINLGVSLVMNWLNSRVQLIGR